MSVWNKIYALRAQFIVNSLTSGSYISFFCEYSVLGSFLCVHSVCRSSLLTASTTLHTPFFSFAFRLVCMKHQTHSCLSMLCSQTISYPKNEGTRFETEPAVEHWRSHWISSSISLISNPIFWIIQNTEVLSDRVLTTDIYNGFKFCLFLVPLIFCSCGCAVGYVLQNIYFMVLLNLILHFFIVCW